MVTIREKKDRGKVYYYLEHSTRDGKKIMKKEKYLGTKLPKNVEDLKKEFLSEIYKEKWYPILNRIKENFSKELKKTPHSSKDKNLEIFAIRFTYDTQRIEGSTLTLRETANLLEKGITPNEKPISDVKEAEAHKKLFYEILDYKKDLSLHIILYWHKKLFQDTKPKIAGQIRKHQVLIT